ncbi:YtxH domain-containing protein [Alteribacillus iranensis]|uniref:Uncharacterized protein n=1 Tax=Alteribacillus iranensis TaxID=930128 RepID=A0A1I2EHS0_9BACI|nr:YtxH domain-containing protein [Alteribacillus iranensis]SFE92634.1 hypothetical protein SAMN05192532_10629 [Alteribacillus iranensis]
MAGNDKPSTPSEKGTLRNYVIAGSLVGGSIGYLSSGESGKKIVQKISESKAAQEAGIQLRQTVQEIAIEQLTNGLRTSINGYMNGSLNKKLLSSQGISHTSENDPNTSAQGEDSMEYKEMKNKTDQMEDRLDRIEGMLSKLLENTHS